MTPSEPGVGGAVNVLVTATVAFAVIVTFGGVELPAPPSVL